MKTANGASLMRSPLRIIYVLNFICRVLPVSCLHHEGRNNLILAVSRNLCLILRTRTLERIFELSTDFSARSPSHQNSKIIIPCLHQFLLLIHSRLKRLPLIQIVYISLPFINWKILVHFGGIIVFDLILQMIQQEHLRFVQALNYVFDLSLTYLLIRLFQVGWRGDNHLLLLFSRLWSKLLLFWSKCESLHMIWSFRFWSRNLSFISKDCLTCGRRTSSIRLCKAKFVSIIILRLRLNYATTILLWLPSIHFSHRSLFHLRYVFVSFWGYPSCWPILLIWICTCWLMRSFTAIQHCHDVFVIS